MLLHDDVRPLQFADSALQIFLFFVAHFHVIFEEVVPLLQRPHRLLQLAIVLFFRLSETERYWRRRRRKRRRRRRRKRGEKAFAVDIGKGERTFGVNIGRGERTFCVNIGGKGNRKKRKSSL